MSTFSIGIIADCLRLPFAQSIRRCKELGADGVQLYAVAGELAPEAMTTAKILEYRSMLDDCGLEISALCGDLGGHGFCRADENPQKIEHSKRIIDLALELGSNIVTTHIGVIPADSNSRTYETLHRACEELAQYAHSRGAHFAVETGPEPAARLRSFLDSLGSTGVGVNLDPANLVMVACDDPVAAVDTLAPYIVHTHAKDGICLQKTNPQRIYDFMADGGIEDMHLQDYFIETPIGQGSVPFPAYLERLNAIGYHGYLTIEREVGDDPAGDIALAVQSIRRYLK